MSKIQSLDQMTYDFHASRSTGEAIVDIIQSMNMLTCSNDYNLTFGSEKARQDVINTINNVVDYRCSKFLVDFGDIDE